MRKSYQLVVAPETATYEKIGMGMHFGYGDLALVNTQAPKSEVK